MKKWVVARNTLNLVHEGKVLEVEVPEGTVGFVKHVDIPSNKAFVVFPMTQYWFDNTDLDIADLPALEDALATIKSYTGHHTGNGMYAKYQFNIKLYHDRVPEEVSQYLSEDEISSIYWDLLHHDLHVFMGEGCDGGLKQTFDWISSWHTAGRTGGWLVLEHDIHWANYEELKERYDEAKKAVDEVQASKETVYEYHRYLMDLEDAESDLDEAKSEIYDLAMDLQLIAAMIERGVKGTEQYVSSMEAWQVHIGDAKAKRILEAIQDANYAFIPAGEDYMNVMEVVKNRGIIRELPLGAKYVGSSVVYKMQQHWAPESGRLVILDRYGDVVSSAGGEQ